MCLRACVRVFACVCACVRACVRVAGGVEVAMHCPCVLGLLWRLRVIHGMGGLVGAAEGGCAVVHVVPTVQDSLQHLAVVACAGRQEGVVHVHEHCLGYRGCW